MTRHRSPELNAASAVLGWTYFVCWSGSFYPQLFMNYRRKSVAGLSLDFQLLNMLGYLSYSIYTTCLIWNSDIKHEYGEAFGASSLVTTQDCFFALHGAFITAVTVTQCMVYDRGGQTLSKPAIAFTSMAVSGTLLYALAVACAGGDHLYDDPTDDGQDDDIDDDDGDDSGDSGGSNSNKSVPLLSWLAVVYWLSVIKLAVTVCKYVPQAHLNYVNKSTVGWSIGNILLDFSGGVLSIAQLLLDGATLGWAGVVGNPIKFCLGFVSIVFDVLFMVQHYCLYTDRRDRHREMLSYGGHDSGDGGGGSGGKASSQGRDGLLISRTTLTDPLERLDGRLGSSHQLQYGSRDSRHRGQHYVSPSAAVAATSAAVTTGNPLVASATTSPVYQQLQGDEDNDEDEDEDGDVGGEKREAEARRDI
jgi:cystinosin